MLEFELKRGGVWLADWLNEGHEINEFAPGQQRIKALLMYMSTTETIPSLAEQQENLATIAENFARYKAQMWPEIIDSRRRWNIYLTPVSRSSREEMAEWRAFSILVEIAKAGHLANFSFCTFCRRWIFKIRKDQRFCAGDRRCRQDWFEKPENVKKRNAAKRANRPRRKAGQIPPMRRKARKQR